MLSLVEWSMFLESLKRELTPLNQYVWHSRINIPPYPIQLHRRWYAVISTIDALPIIDVL